MKHGSTVTRFRKGLWKESTSHTISLLLAVVAGSVEAELLSNNVSLLTEIEAILVLVIAAMLAVLKKYSMSTQIAFAKGVLQLMDWILAVYAGNLFAYGFALVLAYNRIGIIGIAWFIGFVAFVLIAVRLLRFEQYRLGKNQSQKVKK